MIAILIGVGIWFAAAVVYALVGEILGGRKP